MGAVANGPVSPVEDRTVGCARVRSEERHDRVGDRKEEGDKSNDRVRSTQGNWIETTFLDGNKEEAHEGEDHCGAHQQPEKNGLQESDSVSVSETTYLWAWNHRSLPPMGFPTQVCLKYLAKSIPVPANPSHATTMKRPCSRIRMSDLAPSLPT